MVSPTRDLILSNPTHLFVGNSGAVARTIVQVLQQILCTQQGCTYCSICQGIYARSSAHLLWLEPENNYTREQIQPIFETLSFQRPADDYFFIVIAHAERLQQATANALLKSLEEPAAGYYFLLMSAHEHLVLPTIRSRAIFHAIQGFDESPVRDNQLYNHFVGTLSLNPVQFLQTLDQLDLSDQESIALFDLIMQAVQRSLMQRSGDDDVTRSASALKAMLAVYMQAALLLPQSGSSKVFWKNLYLKTNIYRI